MDDRTLFVVRRVGSTAILHATESLSEADLYRRDLGGNGIVIEAIDMADVRPAA